MGVVAAAVEAGTVDVVVAEEEQAAAVVGEAVKRIHIPIFKMERQILNKISSHLLLKY